MPVAPHPAPTAITPAPGAVTLPRPGADANTDPRRLYRTTRAYATRADKALYIADKYASILRGSVLDVGCGDAPLRTLVADPTRYIGIDFSGAAADIVLDLDHAARTGAGLPIESTSVDTVVCTDVLEHLEHAHAIFDELCRVARERVIVSLPNPLLSLLLGLLAGSGGRTKYYGLPVDPPLDRHRWFFHFDDAVAFVSTRGARNGFTPEQIDAENRAAPSWRGLDGRELLALEAVRNGTMWAVLRRTEAA
jgi:SAM-dependent methyltransferase